ncbi:amidase domain-containing protein [Lentzea terrae]|uniref:amidase domain-containing protein n=1 Tax=Lentzea terrae TaxID=2200761 RepID=UPI000DD3504B|nr:amidase domain-containing protein [Lentzea terrae]
METAERSKYPALPPDNSKTMSVGEVSARIDSGVTAFAYNYQAMVDYATRWAYDRNPNYRAFGQDCTNLI